MAGERILVCDDDPQILRALRLVLRGAGYEVLTSATAEEALDRAAVGGPHAAIIDLMLPDRPGIEVCRELRSWSELPIIVLSAVTEEDAKVRALQSGADDYVTKPFAPGELVARVQAVLRRAGRAATEPTIETDGLVIDIARHAVSLDGEEVHLTPLEFALLRALALNRGLLMTHRKLLTEVWGYHPEVASRTVDTHIKRLRDKLDAAADLLQTVRCVGFRLADPALPPGESDDSDRWIAGG